MRTDTDFKVLYIVSDSRSGSTLLQYLLAFQDGVVALGEIRRLEMMVKAGEPCACGSPVLRCPFWRQLAYHVGLSLEEIRTIPAFQLHRRRFGQVVGWAALKFGLVSPVRRLLAYEQRAAANCFDLYRAAAELTGSHVVVDSSKVPSQFLHLYLENTERVYPVFLVRDGRAVVWSKMQRTGISSEQAARQWLNVAKMMSALGQVVPDSQRSFVRYEELCENPHKVLRGILGGMDSSTQLNGFCALPLERHDLGGSPSFREKVIDRIVLDERWRLEMPAQALQTFDRFAGKANKEIGYF